MSDENKRSTGFEEVSVLVVDDNRHMRRLIRSLLGAFRIRRVHEAEDGGEALKMLQTNNIDIIVTDLQMAPLDGLEFTRMIRNASDSRNPFVPVIMVSAFTDRISILEARNAGITEFLAKPLSAEQLYRRIHAVVHSPRPFVRAKSFFGPDRRRHWDLDFDGEDRRAGGGASAEPSGDSAKPRKGRKSPKKGDPG